MDHLVAQAELEFLRAVDAPKSSGGLSRASVKEIGSAVFKKLREAIADATAAVVGAPAAPGTIPEELLARLDRMEGMIRSAATVSWRTAPRSTRSTYAEAVAPPGGGGGVVRHDITTANRFGPLEKLIVEVDENLPDTEIEAGLMTIISPRENRLKIERVHRNKGRWKMEFRDAATKERVKTLLEECQRKVVDPGARGYELLIRNLPESTKKEDLPIILSQNEWLSPEEQGLVVAGDLVPGRGMVHLKVSMPRPVAKKILEFGCIYWDL
jgi:hypothetical protein